MPNCVRRKLQHGPSANDDLVGAGQVGVPLLHCHMRDAVDFDAELELTAVPIQEIGAAWPADSSLMAQAWKLRAIPDRSEITLGKRLDAAGGIEDRLDDQGAMPTGAAAGQGLSYATRVGQALLQDGDDDGPNAALTLLPAREINCASCCARATRFTMWMNIEVRELTTDVSNKSAHRRVSASSWDHNVNPVVLESGEPINLEGGRTTDG
jgi:hypothetical protein